MIWPFRKKTDTERFSLPSVPDDLSERRKEKQESEERLQQARELRARALPVAEDLRDHNRRNHYTARIAETYVLGGFRL